MSKRLVEDDFIGAGFHRVDHVELAHPPKIHWGEEYKLWTLEEKVQYLEKLAASMNHAAKLLQDERDRFGQLCEIKEAQIVSLNQRIAQESQLLQSELIKMNEEKQKYLQNVAKLNAKIRELERERNS